MRVEKALPLPEICEQNLSHSFKSLNKTNSSKKPPKLLSVNWSRIRNYSSPCTAQPITFKDDVLTAQLSPIYRKELPDSYFQQCFEIVSKIGEGSFGEVFKVRSREDGQYYAVKKSKDFFRSREYRKERLEEVKRYEEFSEHEHCVTLYKAWEQDYQLYMQMELCQGSLESYVLEHKVIAEELVWSFLLDLLLALKSFHDRNLIHLDVKLDNILVTEDGSCKLGDFGLMFDLERDNEKAVEGDCRYIAPEELSGTFSKAADVFSLGITVLELSCNLELPANGVLWQQLRSDIFPPEIVSLLSPELFQIIQSMMASDWRKRPSVDALLAYPRLRDMYYARKKWALVNKLKKLRRDTRQVMWRKLTSLRQWLSNLIMSITTLFNLRHMKRPSTMEPMETTPTVHSGFNETGLNGDAHLLSRINAIPVNSRQNSSFGHNMDVSHESMESVQTEMDDGRQVPVQRLYPSGKLMSDSPSDMVESGSGSNQLLLANVYSSTPINRSGVQLRRSRVLTPNSPLNNGSFNRSLNNSEHVSSFTVKKLFDQSDDSSYSD